jgi:hypothetical protein
LDLGFEGAMFRAGFTQGAPAQQLRELFIIVGFTTKQCAYHLILASRYRRLLRLLLIDGTPKRTITALDASLQVTYKFLCFLKFVDRRHMNPLF